MGKVARGAVLNYWKSKISTINTPEDRSQYAKRERTDLRFVYKDPGAAVSPFKLEGPEHDDLTVLSSRAARMAFFALNSFR